MKKTIMILGIAAVAMAVSCTREEAFKDAKVTTIDVDQAYVTVVITEAGSSITRADDATFENGTADERKVARAEFYFYDHYGEYVTSATVWNGGEPTTDGTPVEFEGKTVIVLDDIYGKQAPMYMVTVLNPDEDFEPAKKLSDFGNQYSNDTATDGGLFRPGTDEETGTSVNFFTMSTTSWGGQEINLEEGGDAIYFVNEIKDENFQKAPTAEDDEVKSPVTVYVERLAAKVEVGVADALSSTAKTVTVHETDENGETTETTKSLYLLEVTIAGDENSDDDEDEDIGAEEIYVELIGWKLNATSKQSFVSKNIDETKWGVGDNNYLSFTWNDPDNCRSYWAMSPSYGWTGAPTSSNNLTEEDEEKEWADYYLNYVSLGADDSLLPFKDGDTHNYTYCAENTNTVGENTIQNKNSSLITSVLIKARLYIQEAGNNYCTPLENVVRYEGVLWTEDRYIDYVLEHADVYSRTESTVTDEDGNTSTVYKYTAIDKEYADASLYEDANSIMYVEIGNTTGPYYDRNGGSVSYDELKAKIDTYNKAFQAVGYTGGLMYYTIPIKHLGGTTTTSQGEDGEDETLVEGQYGVVRNHYYKINVTSLTGVGRGISNKDEIIVPNGDDEDDTIYAVGAQINILSWRLVEQDVEL